ncbi:hypothetical protein Tco_1091309 [Tanacetum coccineum]|uniref:Uncharacterized protein n=1 Tax=Tanacetum coccineum TaxID=301880 RepID=A0ABQ5I6M8_9ASTR
MDLKLNLLNRIHLNKSNDTHITHQKLYDTLYESIILDQDALDAQSVQSSFHKRSHNNQDPPNNREGKNKKKRRKDVGKPSSRSSRQNRSLVVIVQDDTPAMQPLDQQIFLSKNIPNQNGFQKSQERLKVQYNNDVELKYHVSQLKAAVLSDAQWNSDKGDVSKPRSFERHMSKSTKPHPFFYNDDYTYLLDLSTEEKYTTSITKHYAARYYKEGIEDKIPERWSKEVSINTLKLLMSVVRVVAKKKYGYGSLASIVVRISNDKEYGFSYTDLPRLSVNDVEDITVIKNRIEDIQLGVERYQRTLNLTKPTMFFEGIDQRIPFTMTAMHKGIQENLIDMLLKNKLGSGNKRLEGRDWTNYDVKSSKKMLKKIDKILRHIEQLRRLEEYVGGCPKTVNPCTFVRPYNNTLEEIVRNTEKC